MANAERATAAPITVNSSVRKYLTEREVERLIAEARKSGRYGHRDATMILLAFRHGLRPSELCDLLWSQVELAAGRLHVRRVKSGTPSVHPLQGDELRALRRLQRVQQPSAHVFATERGGPMAPKGFNTLFRRIGERADMPFPVHPHMLRHACGYALANAGHDHSRAAGVSRSQEYSAHGALHRACAASVQGLPPLWRMRPRRRSQHRAWVQCSRYVGLSYGCGRFVCLLRDMGKLARRPVASFSFAGCQA